MKLGRALLGCFALSSLVGLAGCAATDGEDATATGSSDLTEVARVADLTAKGRFFRSNGSNPSAAVTAGDRAFFFGHKGTAAASLDRAAPSSTWLYEVTRGSGAPKPVAEVDGQWTQPVAFGSALYFIVGKRLPTAAYGTGYTLQRSNGAGTGITTVALEGNVRKLVATEDALYAVTIVETAPKVFVARVLKITRGADGAETTTKLHETSVKEGFAWVELAANEGGFVFAAEGAVAVSDGNSPAVAVATGRKIANVAATRTRLFFVDVTLRPTTAPVGSTSSDGPYVRELVEILGGPSAPRVRGYGALPSEPLAIASLGDAPVVFTKAGITTVDVANGSLASFAKPFLKAPSYAVVGSALYAADTNGSLFATDGTLAGTKVLAQATPKGEPSSMDGAPELVAADGGLYYVDGENKRSLQLRKWDLAAGTSAAVSSFPRGAEIDNVRSVFGRLVFGAGGSQKELWTYDGTTLAMSELNPYGNASMQPKPFAATPSGRVFFTTSEDLSYDAGVGLGQKLWSTDGTAAGTRELRTGRYGDYGYPLGGYRPIAATAGNRMCVLETQPEYKRVVVCTDGSKAGTIELPLGSGVAPVSHGGGIFLSVKGGVSTDLVRVDGTTGARTVVRSLPAGSKITQMLSREKDVLVFVSSTDAASNGVWVSDGTAAGTLRMVVQAPFVAENAYLLGWNGATAYACHGRTLYATDGTVTGTAELTSGLYEACTSSTDGRPFGAAFVVGNGNEVWRLEGKQATKLFVSPSKLYQATTFDGGVAFTAASGFVTSDGTTAGSVWHRGADLLRLAAGPRGGLLVSDWKNQSLSLLRGGALEDLEAARGGVAANFGFVPVPGGVVFTGRLEDKGMELLFTDGTVGGTRVLAETYAGAASSDPSDLLVAGSKLYFSAKDSDGNEQLYAVPLAP